MTSAVNSRRVLLDVTDLVEFLQRQESVSGVQRVIAETAPHLLAADPGASPVILDRGRGVFVGLSPAETALLITRGASAAAEIGRSELSTAAAACLARATTADPVRIDDTCTLVFLGAVWINDALMLAARDAHAAGARCVYLLYDLTPVLETGHTAAVNQLFDRYLNLITQTASRIPAISESSRRDYEHHCVKRDWDSVPGSVTGLPCGITPDQFDTLESPWPRPYVLFVGTVESRKNHLMALRAWQVLLDRHGPANVPDLVCVGRLGWHADTFLREYVESAGLGGKLSVLSSSVTDEELACFYAHAEFTIYPSRYEGWGLPVSESLAFGRLPVVAYNSSLPEAGRDLAAYFRSDDLDDFVHVIETRALDLPARNEAEARIRADRAPAITWADVADTMRDEVAAAAAAEARTPVIPEIELGREYMLAVGQPAPDAGHADQYLAHLQDDGLTPMLRQPRGERDYEVVDAAVIGTFGSPQVWGNELRPGRRADIRIIRPEDGPLSLLLSTRSMPGLATIEAVGPGGPVREDVYLGSVITLRLGDGQAGEPAQVSLSVVDAHDSIEGFLGIRSFVVLRSDDLQAEVIAHKTAAEALRQELDFVMNTRSWKVTAPLRKFKGRGA
ncbi:MAG: glycosyltransferase family 1 protein [Actinobacteria bacterium]|nr:glycosyltransferase family 1 protein [Actinomycetota bacterium]